MLSLRGRLVVFAIVTVLPFIPGITTVSRAQLSIVGTVSDPDGNPVSGVLVELIETSASTLSGGGGEFSVPVTAVGTYHVRFTKTGWAPTSHRATVAPPVAGAPPGQDTSTLGVRMMQVSPTVSIGPAGGSISVGAVTLTIPAGALAQTENISVTPLPAHFTMDVIDLPHDYLRIGGVHFEPPGLAFAQPATVSFEIPTPPTEEMYDFDGTPSEPNLLLARFVNSSTLEVTAESAVVAIETSGSPWTGTYEIAHFSDVVLYDDFGIGDWWAHWYVVASPIQVLLAAPSTTCNCQQDPCVAPTVEFNFSETVGFQITVGTEVSFGIEGETGLSKVTKLGGNFGLKFSKELTTSWSTQIGQTITFPGAVYPGAWQGPAITQIWAWEITVTHYELFFLSSTPTVIGEFNIRYNPYQVNIPPSPCPPPPPACNDGQDNDNDGCADYPCDEGCDSATDEDESGGGCCDEGDATTPLGLMIVAVLLLGTGVTLILRRLRAMG